MLAHFCSKGPLCLEILSVLQFVFSAIWIIACHNHLTCSRDLSFSPLTAIFHVLNHSSSNQFNLRETMCSGVPNRHFSASAMRNDLRRGILKNSISVSTSSIFPQALWLDAALRSAPQASWVSSGLWMMFWQGSDGLFLRRSCLVGTRGSDNIDFGARGLTKKLF